MFDARLLSVFREVATRGSFSEAAQALSFTQPAVSQQIARLERELGTKLLARGARGVTPTPAGEVLLRHAETVMQQLRDAEAEVQAVAGVERPRLRVGAFSSAAASVMPPALAQLRAEHPGTEISLRIAEVPDSLDALRTGELDLSLIIDSEIAPVDVPSGVDIVPVFDDPFLLALPYSHRLAGRSAVALADLRDEEWMITGQVGGTCPDATIVARAWSDAGFAPRTSFSSDDYAAIQGMVASGMGVAMIPSLALVNPREDVAIRPLRGASPVRRVRAAVAAERPSALADALLDILRAAGRERRWAGRQLAAVA
jgi:DNA-binding transcriptional LysR family regulator